MEFIFSNLRPMTVPTQNFSDVFFTMLQQYKGLDIAVGYITADSLIELQETIRSIDVQRLNITIGMHYIERFTRVEYNAACDVNRFLKDNRLGAVKLVMPFKYHGKLYVYGNTAPQAFIVGSNNLSSIISNNHRIYETSLLVDEPALARQAADFVNALNATSTRDIDEIQIDNFKNANPVLEGQENVEKVSGNTLNTVKVQTRGQLCFDIPLTTFETAPKSNLNCFFGKGREGQNGLVVPRHWYEVEIIVPTAVRKSAGYPKGSNPIFEVITDDGWKFKCNVNGGTKGDGYDNKNFRSEGDLKILGKWIKGRLENAGVLRVGQPLTNDVLRRYGRNTFALKKTTTDGLWFLDFGV